MTIHDHLNELFIQFTDNPQAHPRGISLRHIFENPSNFSPLRLLSLLISLDYLKCPLLLNPCQKDLSYFSLLLTRTTLFSGPLL